MYLFKSQTRMPRILFKLSICLRGLILYLFRQNRKYFAELFGSF